MQAFDPLGFYTNAQVIAALTGSTGSRVLTFRYDHLDQNNTYLEPLDQILSGSVSNNALADIKRTAKFSVLDQGSLNFLSDRIKPWARLAMPAALGGPGYVEWPQGVFLLSTPERDIDSGVTTRQIDAFDQLLTMQQDAREDRYSIVAGTAYTTAIATVIAGYPFARSITPSTLTMPAGMEWDPGTTNLQVVNDLLAAINYQSAYFDENGKLICRPYTSPTARSAEYSYNADALSVITGKVGQTFDTFDVPNKFILIKSNTDSPSLVSVYTNTNPASPTSTVSRGRTIASVITESDAADQATLDQLAANAAFDASQIYETIAINTAIMPIHSNFDMLNASIPGLSINSKYSETSWDMPLAAGAVMTHSLRRVVSV